MFMKQVCSNLKKPEMKPQVQFRHIFSPSMLAVTEGEYPQGEKGNI